MSLIHAMRAHVRDQRGQTFVEYALILAGGRRRRLDAVTWSGLSDVIQAAMDTVAGAVYRALSPERRELGKHV